MGGRVFQDPTVQTVQNPIKLCARVVGKRWWFKSNHHRIRNYYAWTVLRNDDLLQEHGNDSLWPLF